MKAKNEIFNKETIYFYRSHENFQNFVIKLILFMNIFAVLNVFEFQYQQFSNRLLQDIKYLFLSAILLHIYFSVDRQLFLVYVNICVFFSIIVFMKTTILHFNLYFESNEK